MTDIRLSRPEEIPAQKRLWKTAFGDDDAFIDWFYDCRGAGAQAPGGGGRGHTGASWPGTRRRSPPPGAPT